jgi:large subunit ribosomal protein L31
MVYFLSMKSGIHPQWYNDAKVTCACGNTFTVGASKPDIRIDICAKCHPFFTGEMKFVDTLGRVERFQQKQVQAKAQSQKLADKKKKKAEQQIAAEHRPRSLKEMLMGGK